MKIKLFVLFFLILFSSCNGNAVFKQLDTDFEENRWQRTDVKSYDFAIEKDGNYDLEIDFSYVAGVQFAEIPIYFQFVNPQGQIETKDVIIQTKDASGGDVGDCSGDYCDMDYSVFKAKSLKAGKYTVKLTNAFNNAYLPNVLGIGIQVNPSEN